ncbi:MAG: hypothetical protein Aurels2KO_37190 [Aureliella sp.]
MFCALAFILLFGDTTIKVVDTEGRPVENATIKYKWRNTEEKAAKTATNEDGETVIQDSAASKHLEAVYIDLPGRITITKRDPATDEDPVVLTIQKQEPRALEALLASSPTPPNTIAFVDSEAIERLQLAGIPESPRPTPGFLAAAKMDFTSMRPEWEAGYVSLSATPDIRKLEVATGGYVDELFDSSFVRTPMNSFLLPPKGNDKRLAVFRPSSRVEFARWLDPAHKGSTRGYLGRQSTTKLMYFSLVLAFDLQQKFSLRELEGFLSQSEVLPRGDNSRVAELLASIQGVRVAVGRRSPWCAIEVEFASDPTPLASVAVDLLNQFLIDNGTAMPEVIDWSSTTDEAAITFSGEISPETLRNLQMILSLGSHTQSVLHRVEKGPAIQASDSVRSASSKEYLSKVNSVVEFCSYLGPNSLDANAKWILLRIRELADQSTNNVDPEFLKYGEIVTRTLRMSLDPTYSEDPRTFGGWPVANSPQGRRGPAWIIEVFGEPLNVGPFGLPTQGDSSRQRSRMISSLQDLGNGARKYLVREYGVDL